MAVNLVKPGLVKGLIIFDVAAPLTSKLGVASTADFFIKVMRQSHDVYSPVTETTGDSDPQPKFENSLLIYNNVALQGAMVATKAVGLANLVNSSKNPLNALHRFDLGGGTTSEWIDMKIIIERIRFKWNRTAQYVGLSMLCKMTDMTDAEVTGLETA